MSCHSIMCIQNIATYLDIIPKQLSTGPKLPYGVRNGAMAPSPDGNGVLLFGGLFDIKHRPGTNVLYDSILELKSDGQGNIGSWTTLTAKLKYPRNWHVVIPVFMEMDTCELNV